MGYNNDGKSESARRALRKDRIVDLMMEGDVCSPQAARRAESSHFLPEIQFPFCMNKLCILAGSFVVGTVGWWVGDVLGWGFFGAFIVSGIGSVVGVWVGWKIAQKLE